MSTSAKLTPAARTRTSALPSGAGSGTSTSSNGPSTSRSTRRSQSCRRRLVRELLAQRGLAELADARLRDLVDELEPVRQPPLREPRREELAQLVARRRLPLLQHDRRERPLGPLLVRDRDHRRLGDGRVRHQRVLELDRGDPLAAGLDHVLRAVLDLDVAARMDRRRCRRSGTSRPPSSGRPARACRSSRTRPTGRAPRARPSSRRPRASPRRRCARGSRRAGAACPASRLIVEAASPRPRRRGRRGSCGGRRDRRGLGHPPALHDVIPCRCLKPAIIARGTAEPPTSIALHRRQVPACRGSRRAVARMPIQIVGTPAVQVDLLLDDSVEQALRIEVRARDRRASRRASSRGTGSPTRSRGTSARPAGSRRRLDDAEAERVVRRRRRACAGPSSGASRRRPSAARSCRSCSTSPPPRSRRAAGRASPRATRVASSSSYESSTTKTCSIGRAVAELLEQRHEAAVDDHGAVARVVRDVGEVVRVQAQVERVQDEAAARDPEVRLVMLVVVPAERGDAVAALEPELLQRDRELLRPRRRLAVGRPVEALVGQPRDDLACRRVRLRRAAAGAAASAGSPSSGRPRPLLLRRNRDAEQRLGDLGAKLGRPRAEALEPQGALVEPVQRVLPGEADAAEHLDRPLARGDRRLRRERLRRRGRDRGLLVVLGDAPRGPVCERACELDVRVRVRQRSARPPGRRRSASRTARASSRTRPRGRVRAGRRRPPPPPSPREGAASRATRSTRGGAAARGRPSRCLRRRRMRSRSPRPGRRRARGTGRDRARSRAPRAAAPPRRTRARRRRRRASRARRARPSGRPAARPSRGRAGTSRRARRAPGFFSSCWISVKAKSISGSGEGRGRARR